MGYQSNVPRVVYRGTGGDIHELAITGAGNWGVANLGSGTGAPAAAGDPMGYESNGPRVVYRGGDNHVYELAIEGGSRWTFRDLTTLARAPLASGDPVGFDWAGRPHVVFHQADGKLGLLAQDNGTWAIVQLGYPHPISSKGRPWAYVADVPRIVYRTESDRVSEVAFYPAR